MGNNTNPNDNIARQPILPFPPVVAPLTFGRTMILTDVEEITKDNLLRVLKKARGVFLKNKAECDSLYRYYRGEQPILNRVKFERPEINNMIVENRAFEIVTFKTGRFLYKDIQYTNRADDTVEEVNELNRMMVADDKAGKDMILVDWMHIAGHGYRLTLTSDNPDAPFHTYSVDPRRAFVVYSDTVEQEPVMGVYVTTKEDEKRRKHTIYTVYTKDMIYEVENDVVTEIGSHILGDVPLVEYPLNHARLGCFEVVLSILNAINSAQSNRLDGIEQFIQALLVFKGLKMTDGDVAALKREGAICLPAGTDMDYLTKELNQSQAQTLVDDLYMAMLTICGMPNRNGGSSTSDNKGAVVLRDGWSAAATAVRGTKQYFASSERRMLAMVLKAFNTSRDAVLALSEEKKNRKPLTTADIDIHFDEGEYENMLEKSQVFTTLVGSGWVDPRDAMAFSNITGDPDAAYIAGKKFHEEQQQVEITELNNV